MADEIILSYPAWCGESDCPVGVHLMHLWANDDGPHTVCDTDGDHDAISQEEADELIAAADTLWARYARHVLDTGKDPLGNYLPGGDHRTVRRTYLVRFRLGILGVCPTVRTPEGWGRPTDPALREYLNMEPGAMHLPRETFPTLAALGEATRVPDGHLVWDRRPGEYKGRRPFQARVTLDVKVPRSPLAVSRALRAAARKHLREVI